MNQPFELKPTKHEGNVINHDSKQEDVKEMQDCYSSTNSTPLSTCRSVFGFRAARPQSDKWGLSSSSSKMFADLKFLCTTEGKHTSCKYLTEMDTYII